MSDRAVNSGQSANLLAAALGFLFLAAAAVFSYQSAMVNTVRGPSANYLLASLKANGGGNREALVIPPADALRVALKAQPLNPAIVNAAVFAQIALKPGSRPQPAKIALLEKLGWRNTPALQNRIFDAVERKDIGKIVAIADALLRRDDVIDQGQALMRLMELSPSTRSQLADALQTRPNWRLAYFQSPQKPKGSQAVGARAKLAKSLEQRGSELDRAELLPTLGLLTDNGYSREAYDLWLHYRNLKPALVNDPRFQWAYEMRNDINVGMPFEWQLLTGPGFWTELVKEGGQAGLSINWNRNGVPYFLAQRLYLGQQSAGLSLQVDGVDLPDTLADDVSFVLICPNGVVFFDQVIRKGKSRYLLGTRDQPGCVDPKLAIAGRPLRVTRRSGVEEDFSVTLTGLTLRASGS